jgi:hypothetical protein
VIRQQQGQIGRRRGEPARMGAAGEDHGMPDVASR